MIKTGQEIVEECIQEKTERILQSNLKKMHDIEDEMHDIDSQMDALIKRYESLKAQYTETEKEATLLASSVSGSVKQ